MEHRDLHVFEIRVPDPANGRLVLDQERVNHLAHEIAARGLLHPITVRRVDTAYELVAGRHRLEAFMQLHRHEIPCVIIQADDHDAAFLRLAENINRTQITPVEEACQLKTLLDNHPAGVDGLAADLRRRPEWILDRLEILDWPPELQHAIHQRKISMAAARHLVRIIPPELRDQRIRDAILYGCSARTAALWHQTERRDQPPETNTSKFSSFGPGTEYQTKTDALCSLCATYVPIEETHLARICGTCLKTIATARTQQDPLTTSPTNP